MKLSKVVLAFQQDCSCVAQETHSLLIRRGVDIVDCPAIAEDTTQFIVTAADMVSGGIADGAIVIGSSGIEGSILGNKFKNVRAALVPTVTTAMYTREHNDSNLLSIGADLLGNQKILDIVDTWLSHDFIGGRHAISVGMIQDGESIQFVPDKVVEIRTSRKPVKHVFIGNDHAGYEAKLNVLKILEKGGITYTDIGTNSTDIVRYPYYAARIDHAVLTGAADAGIAICGTGIGISIAANKFKGIRASLCFDRTSARIARERFDANVLCLGGKITGLFELEEIVEQWLTTPYEGAGDAFLSTLASVEAENMGFTQWKPDSNV